MDIDLSIKPPDGSPFAEHERIRAHGPIFWSDSLHGWVVHSYDDVKKVMTDSANFSNENTPISRTFGAEAMLVNDSPMHRNIRNVWAKPASVVGVAAITGDIERIADSLIGPLAARLNAGDAVNLVNVFQEFMSEMITSLMDIPSEHKFDLVRWNRIISDAAVLVLEESDPRFKERDDAKEGVYALLRAAVADRRERLGRGEAPQDLVSLMVAAEGHNGITQSIALDNLLNLLLGALDTTVRWMGNILVVLRRHPQALAAVLADRSLLPQALEEVMRVESVVQLTLRIVRNDGIELGGQLLKAGDFVYAMPGAANRDPLVFERPGEFDIFRKPKLHLGFGFGMHQCLGMSIARKEALVFFNQLFDRVPSLAIAECDYGAAWTLWGPNKLVVLSQ